MALDEARAAGSRGEVPVGCVIVRDGEVLARAGNRTLADKDPTAHAELLAIRAAAHALGSERLTGGDVVRARPAALFRRGRSEGRRGGKRRALLCAADVSSPARSVQRYQ